MDKFVLKAPYQLPATSRRRSKALVKGFREGNQCQTLLGVTGSGKTFTMANVIQALNKRRWSSLTIKHWPLSCTENSRRCSLITQWSILSPTTITTSRRHTFRPQTPTLPRIQRSMMKSTSCGIRPLRRCLRERTLLL